MRHLIFFLLTPLLLTAQSPTKQQWKDDVIHLQKVVHEEYPFLFKKTTVEQFDNQVEELMANIDRYQEHEIKVGFARLVSSFEYGHTSLWLRPKEHGVHLMPFNLYQFEDGVFVQGVHKDYKESLGAKVVAIESKPIHQVLKAIKPVVPSENDQFFKAHGLYYLAMPEVLHAQGVTEELKETITLTLEKNDTPFEVTFQAFDFGDNPKTYGFLLEGDIWLDARKQEQTPLWLKDLDKIYYFEHLSAHNAVYVRHSQIRNDQEESIEQFYGRLFDFIEEKQVDKLILDYRLNGGGNNYLNKPVLTGLLKSRVNEKGRLFVVLGRRTYSACQNLVNELDNYTEAIFVGEPTAENINFYGDNRTVELPNSKINVRLSFAWWQDKPQWENADWLAPDLAVDLSFKDYVENQDPVLEEVWNYQGDLVLDPIGHFTNLYMTGKQDQILPLAREMISDKRYRYVQFENQFNRIGYRLLNNNDLQSALYVFQLNTELFPNSANAWDSLAEAHWKLGEADKAKELYKKALEMDPKGPVGANAQNMLNRINHGPISGH